MEIYFRVRKNGTATEYSYCKVAQALDGPIVALTLIPADPDFMVERGDTIDVEAGRARKDSPASFYRVIRKGKVISRTRSRELAGRGYEITVDAFGGRLLASPERDYTARELVGGQYRLHALLRDVYRRCGFTRVVPACQDRNILVDLLFPRTTSWHEPLASTLLAPLEIKPCYDAHADVLYLLDLWAPEAASLVGRTFAGEDRLRSERQESWSEPINRIDAILLASASAQVGESYVDETIRPQPPDSVGYSPVVKELEVRRFFRTDDPEKRTTRTLTLSERDIHFDRSSTMKLHERETRSTYKEGTGDTLPELETTTSRALIRFPGSFEEFAFPILRTREARTSWVFDAASRKMIRWREEWRERGIVIPGMYVALDEAYRSGSIIAAPVNHMGTADIKHGVATYQTLAPGLVRRTWAEFDDLVPVGEPSRLIDTGHDNLLTDQGVPLSGATRVVEFRDDDLIEDDEDLRPLRELDFRPFEEEVAREVIEKRWFWRNRNPETRVTFTPARFDAGLYRGEVVRLTDLPDGVTAAILGWEAWDSRLGDGADCDVRVTAVVLPEAQ